MALFSRDEGERNWQGQTTAPGWRSLGGQASFRLSTHGRGVPMLCVLDLSNAYKQLPLHPSCRKYSIVTLLNPETSEPACFEGKVLPFGSTASVVHFNRCSRLLQCIGWHLGIL